MFNAFWISHFKLRHEDDQLKNSISHISCFQNNKYKEPLAVKSHRSKHCLTQKNFDFSMKASKLIFFTMEILEKDEMRKKNNRKGKFH